MVAKGRIRKCLSGNITGRKRFNLHKTLNAEVLELRKRVEALEHGTPDQEKGMARKQYDGLMNSGKL